MWNYQRVVAFTFFGSSSKKLYGNHGPWFWLDHLALKSKCIFQPATWVGNFAWGLKRWNAGKFGLAAVTGDIRGRVSPIWLWQPMLALPLPELAALDTSGDETNTEQRSQMQRKEAHNAFLMPKNMPKSCRKGNSRNGHWMLKKTYQKHRRQIHKPSDTFALVGEKSPAKAREFNLRTCNIYRSFHRFVHRKKKQIPTSKHHFP